MFLLTGVLWSRHEYTGFTIFFAVTDFRDYVGLHLSQVEGMQFWLRAAQETKDE